MMVGLPFELKRVICAVRSGSFGLRHGYAIPDRTARALASAPAPGFPAGKYASHNAVEWAWGNECRSQCLGIGAGDGDCHPVRTDCYLGLRRGRLPARSFCDARTADESHVALAVVFVMMLRRVGGVRKPAAIQAVARLVQNLPTGVMRNHLPSQKQLKWSQLRVGITVILASLTLGFLLFLMSGTAGLFTPRLTLKSYFDNAEGLRVGAPVRLSGVDIGNVTHIDIVNSKDKLLTPVQVTMRVSSKYHDSMRRDSVTSRRDSRRAGRNLSRHRQLAGDRRAGTGRRYAAHAAHPDFNQVVKASQSTLQNMDALLKRADRILAFAESGKGSLGKLIYDPTLYNRFSATVADFQKLVEEVANGQGSLGALISRNDAYDKFLSTLDKINGVVDDMQQGKGTAGKFLKDPSLYNNANDTIANLKKVTEDINAGKGTLGKLTKDEELAKKLDTTITKLSELTTELEAGQGTAGKPLQRRYALQQRQPDVDRDARPGEGDPREPKEISEHQAAHILRLVLANAEDRT